MHLSHCTRALRVAFQTQQSIRRHLYFSARTMAIRHDIQYSANSDPEKVAAEVTRLTNGNGRWNISATKSGLQREFKFKTFKTTWAFMNNVAEQAAKKKHHPEWSNVYNTTFIRWTTHYPAGLSQLDVDLAAFCDKQAAEMGELLPQPAHQSIQEGIVTTGTAEVRAAEGISYKEGKAEAWSDDARVVVGVRGLEKGKAEAEEIGMCGLTNRVVKGAGDCCVPIIARKSQNAHPADNSSVKKLEG